MNKWPNLVFSALSLSIAMAAGTAHAQLAAVSPPPYSLANGGYPVWYQDNNGLSLELCKSKAVSSRAGAAVPPNYMCTLIAENGFNPALPIVFPTNWPGEAFWTLAEATIPDVGGFGMDTYVAGVEAAFSSDQVINGDQVSFGRIRMRINVPVAGKYVVTHPYGVDTFTVTTAGRRAINMTRDIGIGAPGVFTGALASNLGPFLYSANACALGPTNVMLDGNGNQIACFYTETNPDTGAVEKFIGDPALTEPVLGSPFGTNYVEIKQVDANGATIRSIRTNLFSVSGKIFEPGTLPPLDLTIPRSTYKRATDGVRVDLFAESAAGATLCYRDTLDLIPGTPPAPCIANGNLIGDNLGAFFAKHDVIDANGNGTPNDDLPPFLVVTATDPTLAHQQAVVSSPLVDLVKISKAEYTVATKTLVIEASSSDEVDVPQLVAQGYGRMSATGSAQSITVTELAQPPASVTIKSSAGGADTEPVRVIGAVAAPADNQPPLSANDTANTISTQPVSISVLANDSDPDGNVPLSIDPASITLPVDASGVTQGSVAPNGTAALTYTPPATNVPLTVTFSYKARDLKGMVSELPATVTVNVAPNQAPTAGNDTAIATAGNPAVPVTINVLANDTDPEGNVPLGIVSVSPVSGGLGTATANADGTITFTPNATAGTATFTYLVKDSLGAVSATPGTVTVTVQAAPTPGETVTVTTAELQARTNNRFTWSFAGTSSRAAGNTITVKVQSTNGLVTLGTTNVPGNGRWKFSANNSLVPPGSVLSATISTSFGTVQTVPVTQTR